MKLAILFGILVGAVWAREPNLPAQAPSGLTATKNPLAGNPRAQKAGAKLYQRECSECHGPHAEGMGKAPSLRQPGISQAAPGALQWILRNGAIYHGMPSFAHLPEPQRWQIVTFLQNLNSRNPD
jgi:mono/diheme cytochrome c family protein